MNGLIATSLLTLLGGTSDAQWLDNYGHALQAARNAERPLIVILDKPYNDESSTWYDKEISANESDLLSNYVLCRIDANTEYGQRVARAFKTTTFPHTAVIDKTGKKILHRKYGTFSQSMWADMLSTYQDGRLPATSTVQLASNQPTQYTSTRPAVSTPATTSSPQYYNPPVSQSPAYSSPVYTPSFSMQPSSNFSMGPSPAQCFT